MPYINQKEKVKMKKSKNLFKASSVLFLVSLLTLMSGSHQASAAEKKQMNDLKEEAKTELKPSSIQESLKKAPKEVWFDQGLVPGSNTHLYIAPLEGSNAPVKLRIGTPNTPAQRVDGQSLKNMLNALFPGSNASRLKEVSVEGFPGVTVTGSLSNLFKDFDGLRKVDFNNFYMLQVTDMSNMFSGASSLSRLEVGGFNTQNVTNMSGMFQETSSLTTLDLGNSFYTSQVTDMSNMFAGARSLKTLDLSSFDTSQVRSMYIMFDGANALKSLKLSNKMTIKESSLPEINADASYSGKWQNVGTGSATDPQGAQVWTSGEFMDQYSGDKADTYVWQPTLAGGDVTVLYQDEVGNEITDSETLKGNVEEDYNSTQKDIAGYTFKEVQGSPASGKFTDKEQTVIYVYTKNAVMFNYFKNGYWRDYGFVLEGQLGSTDMDLSTKDKVIHQVELVDGSNNIVKTWNGTPTN